MIESSFIIKSLNATEVGQTNTNDSYILIPSHINASDFFQAEQTSKAIDIYDCISLNTYQFKYVKGREQRLNKLGPYSRDNDIKAGDIICIERRKIGADTKFYINANKLHDVIILQVLKDGYEVIRNDLGMSFFNTTHSLKSGNNRYDFTLSLDSQIMKRKDSPTLTDKYKMITSDGQPLSNILQADYIIIDHHRHELYTTQNIRQFKVIQ